jgi:capsular polysaccharide biosynthesis protein
MNSPHRPDFEPGDFLGVLRRRWLTLVVLTIVGAVAGGVYVKFAPKIYTATASVYVQATGANANQVANGRTSGAVNMDSEAQIVQSVTIATLAAHALHSTATPTTLSKHITVTVPANSQVLQVSCSQSTANASAACAQAFATQFLKYQTDTANSQLHATLTQLGSQVTALQQDVAKLTAEIRSLPANSSQVAAANAQLSSDNNQLGTLDHQVATTSANLADNSAGWIITAAAPPTKPTSPKKTLILPGGLIVGLLLGLIGAAVSDRRDQRVHDAADLERQLDLPVMLWIPSRERHPQPTLAAPRSRAGQLFGELAYSTAAALGEGNHVLFVAGVSAGTSAGVTAASLAAALARTHSDVVLVCADMNGSVIPQLFGLGSDRGLAEVLAGKSSIWEVAQRPADYPRLRVITPGLDTSHVLYDFQHDVNRALIADLRRQTSIVIIEAQAGAAGGDTFSLAEFADAALIVAEVGNTRRPEIAETLQRLQRLHTPVLGAALVPRFGAGQPQAPRRSYETASDRAGRNAARASDSSTGRTSSRAPWLAMPGEPTPERDMSETRPLPMAVQPTGNETRGVRIAGLEPAEPSANNNEG